MIENWKSVTEGSIVMDSDSSPRELAWMVHHEGDLTSLINIYDGESNGYSFSSSIVGREYFRHNSSSQKLEVVYDPTWDERKATPSVGVSCKCDVWKGGCTCGAIKPYELKW